ATSTAGASATSTPGVAARNAPAAGTPQGGIAAPPSPSGLDEAHASSPEPLQAESARNVPRNAVVAPQSRIFIPGSEAVPAEPLPLLSSPKLPPAGGPRPTSSDLERALSRFDELSLEDAPGPPMDLRLPEAPAPAATANRLPSFTELELEGDSLLHAVEVAALAGKTQRGEDTAENEEEVFSLTAEVGDGPKSAAELPKIPLFSDLPPDAFIELFERCPLRRYGMGERIIAQGSVGDAFYVVCEGAVRVVREEPDGALRELARLGDGAFFGEMALLSGAPRSASVDSASEDTQLLEISAPVLAQLSLRYPSVAAALKKFCRQRMLQNVMNQSALFKPFEKSERRTLVERFRARDVNKGTVILREGQPTDGLYIVLSGEVQVEVQGQVVARLHEGELFGEMSLLKKSPATATVTATRRTSLIRLPREDFDALILTHPQILVLVSELTDDRQRQNEAVLAGSAEVGEQGLLLV
ncbi:MAG: cyclic nucleotide-binding domain-containing protein, partial [Myxococcaceae bacterium]|nr:cyclic nucleotide-binding domain-containing protein [Myxococcaceae bacterium]